MSESGQRRPLVRPKFLVWLFIIVLVLPTLLGLLLPTFVGSRLHTRDLALRACINYLKYASSVSFKGRFGGDFSKLPNTNFWRAGFEVTSAQNYTNLAAFQKAVVRSELSHSYRAIFNSNQAFWAKTNFSCFAEPAEAVIVCKQPFPPPQSYNGFGCRFGGTQPVFAVGFSDGSASLVSGAAFSNLALSGFVPLSSLGVEGFQVVTNNSASR